MTTNTNPMAEDIAEIIISHFPNGSRRVLEEMSQELDANTTNKIILELEKLVSEYEPSDSNIVIQTKAMAAILNLKNRIAELRKTL